MGTIRHYVTNTFPRINYSHSEYEKLRNWQISDQSTSDIDVSINSSDEAISTESTNPAHSLETG